MNGPGAWFCAQMGGREHYAVPRALFAGGLLGGLLTDVWAGDASRTLLPRIPARWARSLAARHHSGIPDRLVRSMGIATLGWEIRQRWAGLRGGTASRYRSYCEVGRRFSRAVARQTLADDRVSDRSVFFGYDTCSLEAIVSLKERGVYCIVDQINPCRVEYEAVKDEEHAWEGWASNPLEIPEEFFERHTAEWEAADVVVVNSDFSRDALVLQGVPDSKLRVIPLAYERPNHPEVSPSPARRDRMDFSRDRPLRVLFLGQVMLRKGIQYLVQAAALLREEPVSFDIVGPIHIDVRAAEAHTPHVHFHGSTSRANADEWFRSADLFVLPTISDGFAITQLEAMSYGLPVVATPNCGSVVTDATDGFIVPARNSEALAQAIAAYVQNPLMLRKHGDLAVRKVDTFSIAKLGRALAGIGLKGSSLG